MREEPEGGLWGTQFLFLGSKAFGKTAVELSSPSEIMNGIMMSTCHMFLEKYDMLSTTFYEFVFLHLQFTFVCGQIQHEGIIKLGR